MVHGLSCSMVCEILALQSGIEPASHTLEDGFLTIGPPRKSCIHLVFIAIFPVSRASPDCNEDLINVVH